MYDKTLWGSTRRIPDFAGESGWASDMTGLVDDFADHAEETAFLKGAAVISYMKAAAAVSTLAAGATLVHTNRLHRIQGSGGAVTLSAVTAVDDGAKDGQLLTLTGGHMTNVVTIPHNANVLLAQGSQITLGLGECLDLRWDSTLADWVEMGRSAGAKFQNQSGVDLYEAAANGTNKVTLRAAALMAGDYVVTWPAAAAAGFLQMDVSGNLSVGAGSASLDTAYHSGNSITVDGNPVILTKAAGVVAEVLQINQSLGQYAVRIVQNANFPAISINQVGTGTSFSTNGDITVANQKAYLLNLFAGTPAKGLTRDASDVLSLGDSSVAAALKLIAGNSFLSAEVNGAERWRVKADGKMGIGATDPRELLELYNGSFLLRNSSEVVGNIVRIYFATGSGDLAATNELAEIRATIKNADPGVLKSALGFYVNQGDLARLGIYIDENGRVAVAGNSTASAWLQSDSSDGNDSFLATKTAGAGNAIRATVSAGATGKVLDLVNTGSNIGVLLSIASDQKGVQLNKAGGVGNTNPLLDIVNGTTADSIFEDSGAKLTAAGVWTDAVCFSDLKTDIQPIATDQAFLAKIASLSFSRYRTKRMKTRGGEDLRYGLFLEELMASFGFRGDGVAPGEVAALAVGGVKALVTRVAALEARIAVLEAKP